MPPRAETVSLTEAAKLFGKTPETLRLWRREGCPCRMEGDRPRFVLAEMIAWREEKVREEERPAASVAEAEARARKMTAQARMAELELAAIEGRMIDRKAALAAAERMLGQLRSQLLSLPQRWASRLVGIRSIGEVTAVLDRTTHELMATLSGAEEPA